MDSVDAQGLKQPLQVGVLQPQGPGRGRAVAWASASARTSISRL